MGFKYSLGKETSRFLTDIWQSSQMIQDMHMMTIWNNNRKSYIRSTELCYCQWPWATFKVTSVNGNPAGRRTNVL